jgi:hypothetical protein
MSDFSRSLHNSGGEHVAWLLWSTQAKAKPAPLEYRQGSMFFLDCGRIEILQACRTSKRIALSFLFSQHVPS